MSIRRMATAAAASIAVVLSLAACGTPPWEANATGTPTPTATVPTPQATVDTVVNELATGSTERVLTAGNITLTVDYWSTLSMDQWTADANKPLSFSAVAELKGGDNRVYLSKVSVVTAVRGDGVQLTSPDPLADSANVAPGYFISSPYSYSQSFVLPPIDPAAESVQLTITYELLLQTTPTSTEYAKQTATDTLTIAIAQP
ncbi:hypothetical protein [Labedella gwakjiensis]|uniref:Lipoprotein LpqN n=2 Tax=Labedella gwakjiensis TaxID=390269 RepID=A0ABY0C9W3_9MICO|nr:hypothetical protein [Labedella gwakjiensis]RUQ86841.1 hypothetical protein ELQ93_07785 [Labedella gwakjiensis]